MSDKIEELKSAINDIIDKKCWAVSAGEGTGSVVGLYIGDKFLRKNELKNDKLEPILRKYDSELSLLISCAWRLDTLDEVLCSSTDSNENAGNMITNLLKLQDLEISSANITTPALDLKITFENNMTLHVFCNETNFEDDLPNYTFYTMGKNYLVDTKSRLEIIVEE
ncbi:MAG: hypothetical protein KKD86_13075 [Bacteroidetes bacterium]|nr:hypothetical protein [Bacteroidota bacterium]MBU1679759.1 hypothetical protein [Bacteroidota bacterium]